MRCFQIIQITKYILLLCPHEKHPEHAQRMRYKRLLALATASHSFPLQYLRRTCEHQGWERAWRYDQSWWWQRVSSTSTQHIPASRWRDTVTLTEKCDCVDSDDNVDHCDIDNHGDLIVHGCFIKKHCHKYQCWRWRRQGYISTITILTVRNDHDDDAGFCMFLLFWWLRRFCQPNSLGLTKSIKNIAHSSHKAPVETLCKELQVFQLRLCAGILHEACKELASTLNSIRYENQHWQWVEVGYSHWTWPKSIWIFWPLDGFRFWHWKGISWNSIDSSSHLIVNSCKFHCDTPGEGFGCWRWYVVIRYPKLAFCSPGVSVARWARLALFVLQGHDVQGGCSLAQIEREKWWQISKDIQGLYVTVEIDEKYWEIRNDHIMVCHDAVSTEVFKIMPCVVTIDCAELRDTDSTTNSLKQFLKHQPFAFNWAIWSYEYFQILSESFRYICWLILEVASSLAPFGSLTSASGIVSASFVPDLLSDAHVPRTSYTIYDSPGSSSAWIKNGSRIQTLDNATNISKPFQNHVHFHQSWDRFLFNTGLLSCLNGIWIPSQLPIHSPSHTKWLSASR